MGINRRLSVQGKLPHHRLFGSLETPPLGWAGEEHGFKFSLQQYKDAVAALVKQGKSEKDAHREVARFHGHKAWNWLDTFYTGTVYVPPHVAINPPMSADRDYRFRKGYDLIIAGWWYDRHNGLGPTSSIAAWTATSVGYISKGKPYPHRHCLNAKEIVADHSTEPVYRDTEFYPENPHCVGINPYRDFSYLGEFTRPLTEYPDYVKPVWDAVLKSFYKRHGIVTK